MQWSRIRVLGLTSECSILQVLISDLTKYWPAQKTWTSMTQLVDKYGDVGFKVSQAHGKKIKMKLKDYAAYMACQHDEEPLYIFDAKVYDGLYPILSSLSSIQVLSLLSQSRLSKLQGVARNVARIEGSFWKRFLAV